MLRKIVRYLFNLYFRRYDLRSVFNINVKSYFMGEWVLLWLNLEKGIGCYI